jgi:tRNA threonylcarbamoyladenosine biosynthesis protein TsaB
MIVLWNSADMLVRMVLVKDGVRVAQEWQADRTLARDMLAYMRDRLAEHDATLDDIEGIGVFRGPGSFTGLRIGMTVLNTLAQANRVAIVGELGNDWEEKCLERLLRGDNDHIVLPEYGGDAHVTKPRK